ncbi:MAG: DNA-binding response regulator, partial [Dermabacter sp.]|nr:DNA-binding response regulator [Dermabacter sp.]
MNTEQEQDYEARLLVVDDEPNIRDLLATSLRFAG